MKTTTCLAVLLICVTFKSSAAQIPTPSDTRSTNVLAQQAALMAPGQWVVLNQAGDGSGYDGNLTSSGMGAGDILAFASKATYDPVRRRVIYTGGGHGGGPKGIGYEVETNRWSVLANPVWLDPTGNDHSYQLQALIPGQRYLRGLANTYHVFSCSIDRNDINAIFDSADCPGDQSDPAVTPPSLIQRGNLEYFPERNSIIFNAAGSVYEKRVVSPWTTDNWALLADIAAITSADGVAMAYNATDKVIVFGGGAQSTTPFKWWKIDTDGTISRIDDAPIYTNAHGLTLFSADPSSGKYVLIRTNNADNTAIPATAYELWELDPKRSPGSQWTYRSDLSTNIPQFFTFPYSTNYTVAVPIPEYGVIMYLDYNKVWLYKHSASSGVTPLPLPNTPPVISGVSTSSITFSSATISWATDKAADSQVEYGPTTAYGQSSVNSSLVTTHGQILPSLSPSNTYHYRVKAKDSSGNVSVSADFSFTTTAAIPASTDPVAWWKFDETGGTTAADSSGNNNTASLVGGPVFTAGTVGNALSFNGSNQYVTIPHSPALNVINFTVSLWVYPKAVKSDWQPLITKENATGGNRNYGLYILPNTLKVHYSFQAGDCSTYRSFTSLGSMAQNAWNLVTMSYDGSSFKLYLNDALDSVQSISSAVCQNTEPVKLGSELSVFTPFNGNEDDVRLYNRVISASEVSSLYTAGAGTTSAPPPPAAPRPSGTVGGYPMPSVDDEKQTYRRWGWTWNPSQEPNSLITADPYEILFGPGSYVPSGTYNVDVHGDTEGDDLWTYLLMYLRSGNAVIQNRAVQWARYFNDEYAQCVGVSTSTFCSDRDGFGGDHIYGYGLLAYYEHTGNSVHLTAAINIGAQLETLWNPSTTSYSCVPGNGCMHYGFRLAGRHLLLATRLAEVTNDPRWTTLRDRIFNTIVESQWFASEGLYIDGADVTDMQLEPHVGPGATAKGWIGVHSFSTAILMEAYSRYWRATGDNRAKTKLLSIAQWFDKYGLEGTYQYSGSFVFRNINTGQRMYFNEADPSYTTCMVNLFVMAYKFTGNMHWLDVAKNWFDRGNKGVYAHIDQREAADNAVGHFTDTEFDTSNRNFYLARNKGELIYTYLIFENGGAPTLELEVPDQTLRAIQPPRLQARPR